MSKAGASDAGAISCDDRGVMLDVLLIDDAPPMPASRSCQDFAFMDYADNQDHPPIKPVRHVLRDPLGAALDPERVFWPKGWILEPRVIRARSTHLALTGEARGAAKDVPVVALGYAGQGPTPIGVDEVRQRAGRWLNLPPRKVLWDFEAEAILSLLSGAECMPYGPYRGKPRHDARFCGLPFGRDSGFMRSGPIYSGDVNPGLLDVDLFIGEIAYALGAREEDRHYRRREIDLALLKLSVIPPARVLLAAATRFEHAVTGLVAKLERLVSAAVDLVPRELVNACVELRVNASGVGAAGAATGDLRLEDLDDLNKIVELIRSTLTAVGGFVRSVKGSLLPDDDAIRAASRSGPLWGQETTVSVLECFKHARVAQGAMLKILAWMTDYLDVLRLVAGEMNKTFDAPAEEYVPVCPMLSWGHASPGQAFRPSHHVLPQCEFSRPSLGPPTFGRAVFEEAMKGCAVKDVAQGFRLAMGVSRT